jgi:hypothetical protein
MPGSFEEREKGYEAKWVHDQELRFKLYSRRNRLLGIWAAGEMGLTGPSALSYAGELVAAEFDKGGDEAIFAKIRNDFDSHKTGVSDHMIRRKMAELLDAAKADIEAQRK